MAEYDEALLSNLTVPELQQECKKRGLKKSGVKIKLIQRLAEHIQKYGPEASVPTATPAPEPVIEKSVNAIHNPHPYMAEYEEQLIEGANNDNDDYYNSKDGDEVDIRKVEHSDSIDATNYEEPAATLEPPSPEIPQLAKSYCNDENGHNGVLDDNVEQEAVEDSIHKPSEDDGRIVHLPGDKDQDDSNGHEGDDDIDMHEDIDDQQEEMEKVINDQDEKEEDGDDDKEEEMVKEDAVSNVLHIGDGNEGIEDKETEENVNGNEETEEENQDEEVGRNEINAEEEVGEEFNEGVENEEEEVEAKGSDSEEEGEISLNSEQQAELEESNIGGDDHLDVSVQGEKITEDSEPEELEEPLQTPKPVKKTIVPVSLKKRVSLVASTETAEEKAARRKRRWGATSKDSSIAISSESIKKLIPEMKIDAAALESVPELDYQEDDTVEETLEVLPQTDDVEIFNGTPPPKVAKVGRTVKVDTAKKITLNKSTTSQEVVTVDDDTVHVGETETKSSPPPATQPLRTFMVDDDVEIQEHREKSPSPAQNPISQYIFIENLVRPYTVNQLKSVMRRTGELCEGGFWINNIKSRCYVKFSTEEQAKATRDTLHGLRWPAGSPKILRVDFAVNAQMYNETEGLLGEKPKIVIEIDDKENDPIVIGQDHAGQETRRERKDSERSRSKGERRKKSPKPTEKTKEKKGDEDREESPAKLLDDLFRKTKATPCIYWLPLTEEQILEKEKQEEQNRSHDSYNDRSHDRMDHSNSRNSDRRSHQMRGSNRSWR